jgi:hypothetical protein
MPDAAQSSCVHHWSIEPAEAADSLGACILCGETRVFSNVVARREEDWRLISKRAPMIRRSA